MAWALLMSNIQRYQEPQLSAIAPLAPPQALSVWNELPPQLQTNEHWVELVNLATASKHAELQEIASQARSLTITDSRQYHHTDNRRYTFTDNRRYSKVSHTHSHFHASAFWITAVVAVAIAAIFTSFIDGNRPIVREQPANVTQE
jgi:hypothetical protein